MLGILYLLLCFTSGWAICTFAFPGLLKITESAYDKRAITVSPYFVAFPAWFISGTLFTAWVTYLTALLCRNAREPLIFGDTVSMLLSAIVTVAALFAKYRGKRNAAHIELITKDKKSSRIEIFLLAAVALLAGSLMWTTFFIQGTKLYIGNSVFSDFSPHIGMIRSFSYGNNFPTQYSHFAGEDVKYHFMFQFLVGNLEFLGLRLDYAFNLPSIISFVSMFLLAYVLAVKITAKISAGLLTCLFLAFRSSKTLFVWLANLPGGTNPWKALADNYDFIASTPNEEWGLWNLNVFCNQRHLAFGIAGILLIIIFFLPHLYEMFDGTGEVSYDTDGQQSARRAAAYGRSGTVSYNMTEQRPTGTREIIINRPSDRQPGRLIDRFKQIFFTRSGWEVRDLRLSIASGVLLGSMAFFNGAAVIACLLVLFMTAILSKRRLELVITAGITVLLSTLQTHLFIHGNAVNAKLLFGFIADHKTIFGSAAYLGRLLGILPFVLLAAFCLEKGVGRYLIAVFTLPLVFAFTVSLTVDVMVNHKYIMISCMLLSVFAASFLVRIWEERDFFLQFVAIILIIMLTATGLYDYTTVLKKNVPSSDFVLKLDDPLTLWIRENSDSRDIFLTASYSLNQVVLGGAMLYQGWQYYAWSAGYDTFYRDDMVKLMYEAQSPADLDVLVKQNKIRFIIVDYDNRVSELYTVNEDNIRTAYQCVYSEGEGEWATSVYDTKRPLFQ